MDALDRLVLNALQDGVEVCERPYLEASRKLGIGEDELIRRLSRMLEDGTLTRFGPMYNADRIGGAFTLAAVRAPAADFDRIAALVNSHPEVAHNYERIHDINMWFVIGTDRAERIAEVIRDIELETGLDVLNFPKLDEYYVGLKLEAR